MTTTAATTAATSTERDAYPAHAPRDDLGRPVAPAPFFHDWDPTPHAVFPAVGVNHVRLGDVVLGGTHQVDGFGRAEQRGTEARRFDLTYIVGPTTETTARLVLPVDHLLEIKRYFPDTPGGHRYAWIRLDSEEHAVEPTLIPDYGHRATHCCALKKNGAGSDDLNPDGYELSQIMCDGCVGSWEIDYEVVRS